MSGSHRLGLPGVGLAGGPADSPLSCRRPLGQPWDRPGLPGAVPALPGRERLARYALSQSLVWTAALCFPCVVVVDGCLSLPLRRNRQPCSFLFASQSTAVFRSLCILVDGCLLLVLRRSPQLPSAPLASESAAFSSSSCVVVDGCLALP